MLVKVQQSSNFNDGRQRWLSTNQRVDCQSKWPQVLFYVDVITQNEMLSRAHVCQQRIVTDLTLTPVSYAHKANLTVGSCLLQPAWEEFVWVTTTQAHNCYGLICPGLPVICHVVACYVTPKLYHFEGKHNSNISFHPISLTRSCVFRPPFGRKAWCFLLWRECMSLNERIESGFAGVTYMLPICFFQI